MLTGCEPDQSPHPVFNPAPLLGLNPRSAKCAPKNAPWMSVETSSGLNQGGAWPPQHAVELREGLDSKPKEPVNGSDCVWGGPGIQGQERSCPDLPGWPSSESGFRVCAREGTRLQPSDQRFLLSSPHVPRLPGLRLLRFLGTPGSVRDRG